MYSKSVFFLLILALNARGQNNQPATDLFDARNWGVVLEDNATKKVAVRKNVPYLKDDKGTRAIDVYLPPGLKPGENRPAVIFLISFGPVPAGQPEPKDWEIYRTWPQLVAAQGFVGISMETDGNRVTDCFHALFKFIDEKGTTFNIDRDRLGVYAASANTGASGAYLMSADAYKGIKAAVLYYGSAPASPFRKDLPVLFFIAEGDVRRNNYGGVWAEVLKNNAPWTLKMGTGLPHGFDAFEDTEDARKAVKETISFWRNHLEPVPAPSWPHSLPREAVAASYMHDDNKAANLSKEWLSTHPDDLGALRTFAQGAKNARRYAEAETAYRKLGIREDDAFMMMDFAQVLYGNNKQEEAANYVSKAEKLGNVPRFQYVILASILYGNKDYRGSAAYYEKALALEQSSLDFYNLACTYALGGEKEKAFACLDKAIEMGMTSKQQYEGDADFASLHSDPRWKKVVERLR